MTTAQLTSLDSLRAAQREAALGRIRLEAAEKRRRAADEAVRAFMAMEKERVTR